MKYNKLNLKKTALILTFVALFFTSVFLGYKFIENARLIFFKKNKSWLTPFVVALFAVMTIITVFSCFLEKKRLYKISVIGYAMVFSVLLTAYLLEVSDMLYKIDSVEDLRAFISAYGGWSIVVFLIVQILQVTVVPIPGVVTIGAGVLLFGPFVGALLSFVGITLGSVIAFFIGRRLGYKVVGWLVGEDNLKKTMELVKGKDKIVLSFMFLFPFFPDDLLCFVSGLSSMSTRYYLGMICVARVVSTFSTAYSVNGSLIPYNTWWGVIIWAILITLCLWMVKVVYKNSEKIEKFFKTQKK